MPHSSKDLRVDSWLVSAGRNAKAGDTLNVPPILASNYILGEEYAYSRNEGTPGWSALEEIVGGLEHGRCCRIFLWHGSYCGCVQSN